MRKLRSWVKVLLLFFVICVVGLFLWKPVDPYPVLEYDYESLIGYTGLSVDEYVNELDYSGSMFEKGEVFLIKGKLLNDTSLLKKAYWYYWFSQTSSLEEKAFKYETLASIDNGSRDYYLKAAEIWDEIGVSFRAEILKDIYYGEDLGLVLDTSDNFEVWGERVLEDVKKKEFNSLTIGKSAFVINDEDKVMSQAERVTRDWLSAQVKDVYSSELLSVFAERFSYSEEELMSEIGWHEGGRLKQMGLVPIIGSGTVIAKFDNKWYAADENGVFRFEVSGEKVFYPTNRVLSDNVMVVVDTHGINMLVEQAIRNDVDYVVGCCDLPSKIDAVNYLDSYGIRSICLTDRFVYLNLFSDVDVIGSAGFSVYEDGVVFGGREIVIDSDDKIVVMDATDKISMYYDTPARYFKELSRYFELDIEYVSGEMSKVVSVARERDADLIGARIFSENDYDSLVSWVEDGRKVILFHSISYPYGYKLAEEYPELVGFGDIRVEVD